MNRLKVGDRLQIQCYKHTGKVESAWDEVILLEEHKDYLVFGDNKTTVTEANGSTWKTKEPAILYFFKDEWFNIIAQLKKNGIYYYCNISTPFIIEEGTIKYIDYDLDLRIFPTGEFKILDKREYEYHKKIMHYSPELDVAIHQGLDTLIHLYKRKESMFDANRNLSLYEEYKKLKKEC